MSLSLFGTDGVRGRANEAPMTAEIAMRIGMAAGQIFNCGGHRHRVVIGKGTRLSGYMIEQALTAGFLSVGVDVLLLGPLPTPAVGFLTRSMRADAATDAGAAALVHAAPAGGILVNNLGIYELKDFGAITDAEWHRYFEVNVLSGARLARAYFPGMLERNWGRIIFISSKSALVTPGKMIHYGMSKTAQLAVSRGLAALTKGTKVTVNSVLPGPTRSEGIVDFLKSVASDPAARPEQIEAEFFAKNRPSSLLQRMIEPEEIANLVAYLASPLSSATNGAALRVDGGVTPTIGS
jgi:NAD(P)-dependent dehydrogenase (short-subunit alcohol dehydrogenase family)